MGIERLLLGFIRLIDEDEGGGIVIVIMEIEKEAFNGDKEGEKRNRIEGITVKIKIKILRFYDFN